MFGYFTEYLSITEDVSSKWAQPEQLVRDEDQRRHRKKLQWFVLSLSQSFKRQNKPDACTQTHTHTLTLMFIYNRQ